MSAAQDAVIAAFALRLREALGPQLRSITLFGSRARGDARPGSDYDFLVLVDEKTEDLVHTVRGLETQLLDEFGALSGSLVYAERDWERRRGLPIGITIAREGVPV